MQKKESLPYEYIELATRIARCMDGEEIPINMVSAIASIMEQIDQITFCLHEEAKVVADINEQIKQLTYCVHEMSKFIEAVQNED